MADIKSNFNAGFDEIERDPEAYKKKQDEQLIKEKGQAWFDENKRFLDAEWEYLKTLFGF